MRKRIKNSPGGRCYGSDCRACDDHCAINMGEEPDFETDDEIIAIEELYGRVKNSDDQQFLFEVATTCRELFISELAVSKITDEALLYMIAKTNFTWSTAVVGYSWIDLQHSCIDRIGNPALLLDLANDAHSYAVTKINDQTALKTLAQHGDTAISAAAAKKIKDSAFLKALVQNDDRAYVRGAAVCNPSLIDESVITDVLKNDGDRVTRMQAMMNPNLTDQAAIADAAMNDSYVYVRERAARKLTDQNLLSYLAENDADEIVRKAAVENQNMNDMPMLAKILENDRMWHVRRAVEKRLREAAAS